LNFITFIVFAAVAYAAYKYFFTPNNSDKMTLLPMQNWLEEYIQARFFKKGSMATAMLVQSIGMANSMGASITVSGYMG